MYSLPQINHIRWNKWTLLGLKLTMGAACMYYIVSQVRQSPLDSGWMQWLFESRFQRACFLVIALLPLNWYLEIIKWERCVRPVQRISRSFAASGVLRGLALNWVIPFTLGDFMGRMLGIPKTLASTKAIVVCRLYAMTTTLAIGVLGDTFLYARALFWIPVLLTVPLLLLWQVWMRQRGMYDPWDHLSIATFSLLRYSVFFLQFFVLLTVVLPDVPTSLMSCGIGTVLLIRSVVPSLLGALGVREAAIVFVFGSFASDVTPLLMVSFSLWIINIILPSMVGLWPLMSYRFKLSP